MTAGLFLLAIGTIVLGALLSNYAFRHRRFQKTFQHHDVHPTMVHTVSVVLGFFVGFSSSDITQRSSALSLAASEEVSAARSILDFASGVGPSASPIHQAVIEYLQVVTNAEPLWLVSGRKGDAPGETPSGSLDDPGVAQVPPPSRGTESQEPEH